MIGAPQKQPAAGDGSKTVDLDAASATREAGRLFVRFLGYGARAWGGPTAQIDMLRRDLVEGERWVNPAHFGRVLGVYQALPGPEATELCVYFGMLRAGRLGGLCAGLGFLLPGLVLMLALAAVYAQAGVTPWMAAMMQGCRPAVAALLAVAAWRLSGSCTRGDPWLVFILAGSAMASLAGIHFAVVLAVGAGAAALIARGEWWFGLALSGGVALAAGMYLLVVVLRQSAGATDAGGEPAAWVAAKEGPSLGGLAVSGLKAGSMSFGGAYTAIPILRDDAVVSQRYLSPQQFMDGLALTSVIPAPAVMVGAFVGFMGAGVGGALVMSAMIFLPAFVITLAGHARLERLVANQSLRGALDGTGAAAVGLIVATAIALTQQALETPGRGNAAEVAVFLGAGAALLLFRTRWATPAVMLAATGLGAALSLARG